MLVREQTGRPGVGLDRIKKGGRQAGRADGAGTGETHEQLLIRVGGEDGRDLSLEGVDGLEQGTQLGGVALDHQTERVDDRRVGGERLGGGCDRPFGRPSGTGPWSSGASGISARTW